jgi:hypothetical protein
MNQYDTPKHFGIPNPLGPRTHNWKGGSWNEGSLFHGPIYTRPSYNLPKIQRPLFGVGEETANAATSGDWLKLAGGILFFGFAIWYLNPVFKARRR